jgi:transposase
VPILADTVDGVIGVDTHRDTLAAAALSPVGGILAQTATRADATGYQQLLEFADTQTPSGPARRCWAVEGTGSYGAGLTALLHTHGERVVEVARPKRPARRTGAKTDAIDAVRAARETLGHQHQTLPRRRGDREALRVLLTTRRHATSGRVAAINQLKALIVGAPEELRAELRGVATKGQIDRCVGLRDRPARPLEHRMTVCGLRTTAGRIRALQAEIDDLTAALDPLVASIAPWLVELPGVGPITAAQILVSWSYAGRLRSEAAFAALAGTNPIPASSGQVTRHRLNRSGDRQLNAALHTIALTRLRYDPETRADAARRTTQAKTRRDVKWCLKRSIARQLFKLLERYDQPGVEIIRAACQPIAASLPSQVDVEPL